MKHSATASAEGFIYQFYEAIEWCHELKEGQRIYIESYGDIATSENSNIEVKNVAGNLTDKGECFWKTLANWLEPSFDDSNYSKLILLTTQKIANKSKLKDWNNKSYEEKLEIITHIINKDFDEYEKKQIKHLEDNKKNKKPTKNSQIERVRKNKNNDKINRVLDKFLIADSSPAIDERYKELCDLYCKGILKKNHKLYINSLVGFIVSPDARGKKWSITYDDFCNEVSFLCQTYSSGSRIFPTRNTTVDPNDYSEHLFLRKIKDISHHEAIDRACTDYANSLLIVNESFSSGEPKNRYNTFIDEVNSSFDVLYRKHARRCGENIDLDSQDFYDEFSLYSPPVIQGYDSTLSSFRNGVIHIKMDDHETNKKWRLK
ncbi:hypothetical protein [Enterovibrio norvegicus]|uniref:hypothetical protein n=1 Tax=Enterovibrio norvegicus TaxID=188144 RepID=UPI00352C1A2C